MTDVWAPWAACDRDALGRVFELQDFGAQCHALLDLAPKASAKDLSLLPWEEPHEPREFRMLRDAWAAERAVKREAAKADREPPIEDQVREQFESAVKVRDLKAANEALALLVRLGTARVSKTEQTDDDFSRLSEHEVLMLGALVHKLRGEPLTSMDEELIAYVGLLDASAEQSGD